MEQIHFREANDIKHLKRFIVSEGREIQENCHTALGQGYRHLTSVHANLSRLFHEACKISNWDLQCEGGKRRELEISIWIQPCVSKANVNFFSNSKKSVHFARELSYFDCLLFKNIFLPFCFSTTKVYRVCRFAIISLSILKKRLLEPIIHGQQKWWRKVFLPSSFSDWRTDGNKVMHTINNVSYIMNQNLRCNSLNENATTPQKKKPCTLPGVSFRENKIPKKW